MLAQTSIAQSRQAFSALIAATQHEPQAIVRHDKRVAVLVSPEFFERTLGQAPSDKQGSAYERLMRSRTTYLAAKEPEQDSLDTSQSRQRSWARANPFA